MKKQKYFLLVLLAFLFMVFNPLGVLANNEFTDVTSKHWAYEDVQYLKQKGIVEALVGTQFKPNEPITRSKAARMLVKAISDDVKTTGTSYFPDVPKNHPDLAYINKSKELGIFGGYDNGTFGAEDTLTRAQMAKVLVNTFKLQGTYPREFTDVKKDHWARNDILTLAASEVTVGYGNGKFGHGDKTTRAQMATFVTRAVKGSPFKDPNLYTYASTSDFKVDQGMMYLKDASGKWFIPSETHFSNQQIMSAARGLLDKDRYVLLNYLKGDNEIPNRVLLKYSTSASAAQVGLSPFTFVLYTNELRNNVFASLHVEYTWYDVKTQQFNPTLFEEKLQGSLEALFGAKEGKGMTIYLMDMHKKYRTNIPKRNEEKIFTKKFGSNNVTVRVDSLRIYVHFSK